MKNIFLLTICLLLTLIVQGQRTLTTDETWTGTHTETDNVIVPDGITLTIEAGTTVKFAWGKSLKITGSGILHAGNSDGSGASILFTATSSSWGHLICENTAVSWIKNCEFEKGNADNAASGYYNSFGGALCSAASNLTVEKSSFHNNSASYGGGVFVYINSSPIINNSKFYSNTSSIAGGGIYIWQNSFCVIKNSFFYNNNCTSSTYGGGGIFFGWNEKTPKVVNCLIANNSATNNGKGVYFNNAPYAKIINSVIWGNGSGTQTYSTPAGAMQYSAIQGETYTTCLNLSNSNTSSSGPKFTDPSTYDYTIPFFTVLRDAGTNTDAPLSDYLGKSRIGSVDIGPYEVQYSRWTGATNTTWGTASNWVSNLDPTSSTGDVIIPAGLTNYPTGSSPDFTIATNKTMILEPGAKASFGSLINNDSLLLKSDATAISSMIVNTYSGNDAYVQLFLTGGSGTPSYRWHLISSPFASSITANPITSVTSNLATWIESLASADLSVGWVAYNGYVYNTSDTPPYDGTPFSTLDKGKGYNHYYSSDYTYTLSGQLNTSDAVCSLPYTLKDPDEPTRYGLNVLGNPFSSGLDWQAITYGAYASSFPTNTSKVLHYRRAGQAVYFNNGQGSAPGVTGIIPPMQGFFTKTYTSGNIITLPSGARTNDAIPARYKGKAIVPHIMLNLNSGSYDDYAVVRFNSEAKSGADYDFDAEKKEISSSYPNIYTLSENLKYAINGLPFPETQIEIPVTVNVTRNGTHMLKAVELEGLEDYNVYLTDNLSGFTADLNTNPELSFSSPSGVIQGRFILTIGNIVTGAESPYYKTGDFNIYQGYGFINIQTNSETWDGTTGSINIYDLSGKVIKQVKETEFTRNSIVSIPASPSPGLYLVEIKSGLKKSVLKIIIR